MDDTNAAIMGFAIIIAGYFFLTKSGQGYLRRATSNMSPVVKWLLLLGFAYGFGAIFIFILFSWLVDSPLFLSFFL